VAAHLLVLNTFGLSQIIGAMFRKRFVLGEPNTQEGQPGNMRRIFLPLFLTFASTLIANPAAAAESSCPDLSAYYPGDEVNWAELNGRLAELFPFCLQSSEFFALYGASQLNSGRIAEASESLERALLLEPNNGAAQIDYAETLYLQGDLFSALELNKLLLARDDLPEELHALMLEREQAWQSLTREHTTQLDILAGYDNNLNGAPDSSQVTRTLAGEPVILELNDEFRAKSGPYLNFRLANRYRQLKPQAQHNRRAEVRGRASEDTDSDLTQFEGRYAFIKPGRHHSWQVSGGISHLLFGGESLYTATDASGQFQPASDWTCKPFYSSALQHQLFHGQSHLNALETRLGGGFNCPLPGRVGQQQIIAEVSALNNFAVKAGRPGGDRAGWQFNLDWQVQLPGGEFRKQFNTTRLPDVDG